MRRRLHGVIVEHSIFNSRARLGFTEFSNEEREGMPPVPQALVRMSDEPQGGLAHRRRGSDIGVGHGFRRDRFYWRSPFGNSYSAW
jgi:hypothetical protein